MARVQLFDKENVLEQAMHLFWEKGYSGTSTRDLEKAMGMGTSSVYNTFGGKEALFFETLKYYLTAEQNKILGSINAAPSAIQAIKALFECAVQQPGAAEKHPPGCFLLNSVTELANRHSGMSLLAADARVATIKLLRELLITAQQQGAIPLFKDPQKLAVYMQSAMAGLKVTSMMTNSPEELRTVINLTLENLTKE